uniref:Uncharacterized protein n=1 Tax=Anguilla anguilla TaxID=7936 RepID=A0A0E9X036_ANGAN
MQNSGGGGQHRRGRCSGEKGINKAQQGHRQNRFLPPGTPCLGSFQTPVPLSLILSHPLVFFSV